MSPIQGSLANRVDAERAILAVRDCVGTFESAAEYSYTMNVNCPILPDVARLQHKLDVVTGHSSGCDSAPAKRRTDKDRA